jgi:heptose-I-phosphate ethanolaminephosphotransferase
MIRHYIRIISTRGYWLSLALVLYPFGVIASLAAVSEVGFRFWYNLSQATVFNFGFFGLMTIALATLRAPAIAVGLFRLVCLFQFVLLFAWIYHFSLYGQLVGLPSLYALVDTNPSEASEFIEANFRIGYLALALLGSAPLLVGAIRPPRLRHLAAPTSTTPDPLPPYRSRWHFQALPATAFVMVCVPSFSGWRPYLTQYNPILYAGNTVALAFEQKEKLRGIYLAAPPAKVLRTAGQDGPATHVLVIGEAINRSHMSLYGYPRKTTPKLEQMAHELYLMRDACSSRNTTIPALQEMLTFASRENHAPLFESPNIIQLMRAAGFQTYWLSNQQQVGTYDTFVSLFAKSADQHLFVNRRGWEEGISLDEKLFGPLEKALSEPAPSKFVIVHLLGAHASYAWRYPEKYRAFTDLHGVPASMTRHLKSSAGIEHFNQYDNAILYHDYVLTRLIEIAQQHRAASVTYLPDHGEAVGEHNELFGHAENMSLRAINEIPMFFWFSESARKQLGARLVQLEKSLSMPYQSDQTIHTLLDLYGVEYPLLQRRRSLLDPEFTPVKRYCDELPADPEDKQVRANMTGYTSPR